MIRRLVVSLSVLVLVGGLIYFSIDRRATEIKASAITQGNIRNQLKEQSEKELELRAELESKDKENEDLKASIAKLEEIQSEQLKRINDLAKELSERNIERKERNETNVLAADLPVGAISLLDLSRTQGSYVIEMHPIDQRRAVNLMNALEKAGIKVEVKLYKNFDDLEEAQEELRRFRELGAQPVLKSLQGSVSEN